MYNSSGPSNGSARIKNHYAHGRCVKGYSRELPGPIGGKVTYCNWFGGRGVGGGGGGGR